MLERLLNRFHRKLAFAFCLILIPAAAGTDVLLTRALRVKLIEGLTQSLTAHARIAAVQTGAAKTPPEALEALARRLGPSCGCRLTFIARDGRVLGDSELTHEAVRAVENHGQRPEVLAALSGAEGHSIRFSSTLREHLLYAAVPLPGDYPAAVVRVALPLTEVTRQVAQLRLTIAAVSLTMLALALIAAWRLSRSLSRPVAEMARLAQRLSQGDYAARIRGMPSDEHGRLGNALNTVAERIQSSITELSREKTTLSTILANIVEAIAAVDAEGRVIALNPAFCSLLSINAKNALGRPFVSVLRHSRLNEMLSGALKEGGSVEEVTLFHPGEMHFEAHAVPLTQDGKKAGALLVLHDITRLRTLEKIRREFVANVSHELRTPLASIRGFAETLREGAIDDKKNRLEFVEAIEKDAERLSALVEDILDLSAIESGNKKPLLKPLSVLEIARDVAAALKPLADRHAVTVIIKENSALPPARADRSQIKQVFTNLIDNAIKFNRKDGTVTVWAAVEDHWISVAVEDTGQGIPEEDLPRVFERFYRVDKARARGEGGTGLGLSIVKHIVEGHGGSIEVQSRPGKGSLFRFKLPL